MGRARTLTVLSGALFSALVSQVGVATAQPLQSCSQLAGNLYGAADADLQACGFTEIRLAGTTAMPGGGLSYDYSLPDGQTYSEIQTPSGFDPSTASVSEDAAYGMDPAPPVLSPAYARWKALADGTWAPPNHHPYLIVADHPLTDPGSSTVSVASLNWAGYSEAGSGWTEAQASYYEPSFGNTSCSGSSASFWAGIGNQKDALGQAGTASGAGTPGMHNVFYENLPAGEAFPGVATSAGARVVANVKYNGSNDWTYIVGINGATYVLSGSGGYDGSVVEAIAERTQRADGSYTPLMNFQSVSMNSQVGQGLGEMSWSKQWNMTGYATTGAMSSGKFTVSQNSCGG
jgi:hypothetical protein